MSYLEKLNPQQREAVETVNGPVLILAGAGSGKTRVITYRIAHLIEEIGVAPDSILAVTFTNKAAGEMAERVNELVGHRSLAKPAISTFHSFCVRMLRRDIQALQVNGKGYTKDFVIYDESDQQMVVKAALRRFGVDDKKVTPRSILSHISWAKNHMLDPEDVYLNSHDPKTEKVAQVYKVYKQELAKANALDFDDLLLESVRLLKVSDEVREKYQRRYHYLLVDEYQDTNRPQYEIMKALAGKRHNICAVGDEDQSIYSWRGADIRNILEFEQDFPEAKIIRLEQNYRSTQNILEAASAVVRNNVKRKGKNLWTERQGGPKLGYYEAPDGENEALFVADYVSKYLQKRAEEGEEGTKAAVLYRTNSQSRLFEEALRRYGLKYNVVGGFSFYERAEIKDMISYLKFLQNPDDSVALLRVINTPARGIGKTTMETVERIALETGKSLWGAVTECIDRQLLPARACAAMKNFQEIIADAQALAMGTYAERLNSTLNGAKPGPKPAAPAAIKVPEPEPQVGDQHGFGFEGSIDFSPESFADESAEDATEFSPEALESGDTETANPEETTAEGVPGFRTPGEAANVAEIIKFLLDRTGYIKQLEAEDTPESLSRIDNLKELVNAAMDSRDRGETLGEFLDHAALVSDVDQYDASQQITLMTLHAAKGLEFPLVALVGLEEGLFPSSRTLLNPDEIEEERRLCYVGMTRAMDTLILTRARYRRRWGTDLPDASTPSRFLEEIPPQLIDDIGSPGGAHRERVSMYDRGRTDDDYTSTHYDYENEDQSGGRRAYATPYPKTKPRPTAGPTYNSIDNIAEFFASRGKKFTRPKMDIPQPTGKKGLQAGARVKHPKYGEGTIVRREGDGEEAKLTVSFNKAGIKKLVEKYAQLEKV